jgi:hypothetical protein
VTTGYALELIRVLQNPEGRLCGRTANLRRIRTKAPCLRTKDHEGNRSNAEFCGELHVHVESISIQRGNNVETARVTWDFTSPSLENGRPFRWSHAPRQFHSRPYSPVLRCQGLRQQPAFRECANIGRGRFSPSLSHSRSGRATCRPPPTHRGNALA